MLKWKQTFSIDGPAVSVNHKDVTFCASLNSFYSFLCMFLLAHITFDLVKSISTSVSIILFSKVYKKDQSALCYSGQGLMQCF